MKLIEKLTNDRCFFAGRPVCPSGQSHDDGRARRPQPLLAVAAGAVADRGGRGRGCTRLDAQERVEHTDQQPAAGCVADGVRRGRRAAGARPELHQAGHAAEQAEEAGRDRDHDREHHHRGGVHHAGVHDHQHGEVPPAAARRQQPPAAPEPHRRPGAAVQVVRHARLHQRVYRGHKGAAAQLQDAQAEHIQKLRHPSHHRHETADALAHRSDALPIIIIVYNDNVIIVDVLYDFP